MSQDTNTNAPQQIKISDVLNLLAEGKKRKEIYEHYGLSDTDGKKLFKHPKLKGKKPLKQTPFELLDDVDEDGEIVAQEIEQAPLVEQEENVENAQY